MDKKLQPSSKTNWSLMQEHTKPFSPELKEQRSFKLLQSHNSSEVMPFVLRMQHHTPVKTHGEHYSGRCGLFAETRCCENDCACVRLCWRQQEGGGRGK